MNFRCPGETTVSFVPGPCGYAAFGFPLHSAFTGSQLDAALAFLGAHRGQVSPITIDLGANDVNHCSGDPSCIPSAIATVASNMQTILTALRGAAPSAEIIVMEYYNPFALIAPASNVTAQALNSAIAKDAVEVGGRLADAFAPFNLAVPPPLCVLTLFCTPLQDIHASDPGYLVIARQFWSASGYARLSD